jgi:eukaryotic-like serine/threonine-protein kinase
MDGKGVEEADTPTLPAPVAAGDLLLDRYRVIDRLAEGGHSMLFQLEDERLRRPACAKIFHLEGSDESVRLAVEQRFVQEAFLLARLAHPGTLAIYDFGYLGQGGEGDTRGDRPFQICELVRGGPLSRWVKRRGHLGPREVLATILPLCEALADVHAARLVHLDVKPQNILLERTVSGPVPKLADFGIAQSLGIPMPVEVSSLLMYSVNWAAPEQMVGDPVSPSSDVYALALVTIYALTGRLVYHDKDPAQAYRLRKYSSDVLGNALDGVGLGDDLVDLFCRACSFDPAARIADVSDFARQLQAALEPLCAGTTPILPPAEDSGPSATAGDGLGSDRSLPGRVVAASLWPLSALHPPPQIAGRRIYFQALAPAADLAADNGARILVSFVPSSAERPALHVRGINCFVSATGRRPSSALTLDGGSVLELLSPRGERLAAVEVSFATAGLSKSVVTMAGQSLVVPTDECAHLVALDFGPGHSCALVYEPTSSTGVSSS